MFIPEFWVGVFATLGLEMILFIVTIAVVAISSRHNITVEKKPADDEENAPDIEHVEI
jgi:hypothetical protein